MALATTPIVQIAPGIWKLSAGGNVYLLEQLKAVIDTGARVERRMLDLFLDKILPLNKVEKVLFTHLHPNHSGNFDAFPNATLYASAVEIESYAKDAEATVGNAELAAKLRSIDFHPLDNLQLPGVEIIFTPGHTKGSVCFWVPADKILFSGDTVLRSGIGHAEAPTGEMKVLRESINKLVDYNYRILAPGHD